MQVRLLFCLKQGDKYIWNSFFFVLFCFLCLLISFFFLAAKQIYSLWTKTEKAFFYESLRKNIIDTSFTKLVIIQISYTCRHLIDIQHSQEESAYKKLLRFMPFRVHQFKSIQTIVDTFKWFKPEIQESSDLHFCEIWEKLKINFRANLWQRVTFYYM